MDNKSNSLVSLPWYIKLVLKIFTKEDKTSIKKEIKIEKEKIKIIA